MLSLLTNTSASTAQRNLNITNNDLSRSLEKLSSGLRVARASDDVASMAIGSRLNAELTALKVAATNAGQAVSLTQIAEGVYARTNDMLVRMKSLSAQAANGTLSDTERQLLDVEFQALKSEIDRVAADTTFNGQQLVNSSDASHAINDDTALYRANIVGAVDATGDFAVSAAVAGVYTISVDGYSGTIDTTDIGGATLTSQATVTLTSATGKGAIVLTLGVGYGIGADAAGTLDGGTANVLDIVADGDVNGFQTFDFRVGSGSNPAEDVIAASVYGSSSSFMGFDGDTNSAIDISSSDNADKASAVIDSAINYLIDIRAEVGATQNRIETAQNNLSTTIENTEAAKSSYLDADIASEITIFTAKQILLQSGISTLAQANQVPQNLLSLFQQ